MRLVVPPGAERIPCLSSIEICRTRFGSGHAWDQTVLALYAEAGVLSLGNFGSVFARNHVVCIHDANTFILPESYSRTFGLIYRTLLPLVGRRARRVATVSRFSADMLMKYGISREERISRAQRARARAAMGCEARPASAVGHVETSLHPLAGQEREAQERRYHPQTGASVRRNRNRRGRGGWPRASSPRMSRWRSGRTFIMSVGFVGDDELAALYENAMCLVFPSKTEGFGIPPLEAMPMRQVFLKSAEMPLSTSTPMMAPVGEMRSLTCRRMNIFATLAAKGRQRAALFSWKRSAALYLDEISRLQQPMVTGAR
jgi:hypothetical protein